MEYINISVRGPKQPVGSYENVVLKNNIGFGELITQGNTIYHVKWDFDLAGNTIQMLSNCVLCMEGGKLSNGVLEGANTLLICDTLQSNAFNQIEFTGSWERIYTSSEVDNKVGNAVTTCMDEIEDEVAANSTVVRFTQDQLNSGVEITLADNEELFKRIVDFVNKHKWSYFVEIVKDHSGEVTQLADQPDSAEPLTWTNDSEYSYSVMSSLLIDVDSSGHGYLKVTDENGNTTAGFDSDGRNPGLPVVNIMDAYRDGRNSEYFTVPAHGSVELLYTGCPFSLYGYRQDTTDVFDQEYCMTQANVKKKATEFEAELLHGIEVADSDNGTWMPSIYLTRSGSTIYASSTKSAPTE